MNSIAGLASAIVTLLATPVLALDPCLYRDTRYDYRDIEPIYELGPNRVDLRFKLSMRALGEGTTLISEADSEMGLLEEQLAMMNATIVRTDPAAELEVTGIRFYVPLTLVPGENDYESLYAMGWREQRQVAYHFYDGETHLGEIAVTPDSFNTVSRDLVVTGPGAMLMVNALLGGGFRGQLAADGTVYAEFADRDGRFRPFLVEEVVPRMNQLAAMQAQGLCQ